MSTHYPQAVGEEACVTALDIVVRRFRLKTGASPTFELLWRADPFE
ncbi:hypothetical protein [Sphingomonas sp. KR3-1]